MSQTSKTIIFFGNERLATGVTTTAPTLRALIAADYQVAAVVANYERGQSRAARDLEIADVAKEHNIPVLLPNNPADILEQLNSYQADAAVLVAYGKILPQSIIDIFPAGIINIHPSLLPLHRGPTPIERVVLDGSTETGVSLIRLVHDMDAGPIFAQQTVSLTGDETKQALADSLLSLGSEMLIEHLPAILSGTLDPTPQTGAPTYDSLIANNAGVIDWTKSATQIEREIRAYALWPKCRTVLAGKDVVITAAHTTPTAGPEDKPGDITVVPEAKELGVTTGNGTLWIDRLIPAGKKEMTADDFINGHKQQLVNS